MSNEPDHYPISPSGASRWMSCPGSLFLGEGESITSSYAEEGTEAHEAAYQWLHNGIEPEDEELKDHVGHFVHFCEGVKKVSLEWLTEHKVASKVIKGFGGTADFAAVSEDGTEGWIVDYKHGIGVEVVAEGNWQLACYALLLSERWPTVENWHIVIIQPRGKGPPVDESSLVAADLEKLKTTIIERTDISNKDEFEAGEHCRWCNHVVNCNHLYEIAVDCAKGEFKGSVDQEDSLFVEKCKRILELEPALKTIVKQASEALLNRIKKGDVVPGYKAIESLGNREYILSQEDTIKRLQSRGCGKKVSTTLKLHTPAQMEKLGFKDKIADLTHRKVRGIVLAKSSARGEAIEFLPPGDEFI